MFETAAEQGERHGAVTKVAGQLGIATESLRNWIPKPRSMPAPGGPDDRQERIKQLERENRELRRANEILNSAP